MNFKTTYEKFPPAFSIINHFFVNLGQFFQQPLENVKNTNSSNYSRNELHIVLLEEGRSNRLKGIRFVVLIVLGLEEIAW